ncbi:MAG: aspartate--tRNA ligase [Candidatus Fimenecus sp.]
MDNINGLKRTGYCSTFNISDLNKTVTVFGWASKTRDLGSLIFIDLRDRSGLVQLAFDDDTDREIFGKAKTVRNEFVLAATGTIRERASKNMDIPTGEIEIAVNKLHILGKSETPPFEIKDGIDTGETLRLKYRYLDLRRPELQNNIILRHKITKLTRDFFDENGFLEIETPMLIKSTPEGARDYLVPSRIHNGSFYALPQSPQLYKQLSMVAGFDRYMQIARCFRDEDLRADRQPEFTQIDLEMSFVQAEDIIKISENYMSRLFKEILGVEIKTPLKRLTFDNAMNRFGSDKPDLRYGMELIDLTEASKNCGFGVFENAVNGGGTVRAINAKNAYSVLTRKEIDKLQELAKGSGAKGLAFIRIGSEDISCPFKKFLTDEKFNKILNLCDAETNDVILIIADTVKNKVLSQMGQLRQEVAKKLDIIPKDKFELLWITEFPFFEFDEETTNFVAMHHPFTKPLDECLDFLETDKAKVRADCYDLVLNGVELASGSVRITDPSLQSRIFNLLGLSKEESQEKFGYLLEAFRYGAPPHAGMGIGLDRLCMQLMGLSSLRDVIAYPKLQNATEPMTEAPASVSNIQLEELGIRLK